MTLTVQSCRHPSDASARSSPGFDPLSWTQQDLSAHPTYPLAATTLDRMHAATLLQTNGHANALRALLKAEHERGPDFPAPGQRLVGALPARRP